jgi:hypothetical protein
MKKTELIAQLATKFHKVGEIENAETSVKGLEIRMREGVMWYRAGVYDTTGGVMARKAVTFYVQDEGKPTEEAFLAEKLPEVAVIPTPGFDASLKTYLGALDWVGYSIGSIEAEQKYAMVTAYTENPADKTKVAATAYLVKQGKDEAFKAYLLNGTTVAPKAPGVLGGIVNGVKRLFTL